MFSFLISGGMDRGRRWGMFDKLEEKIEFSKPTNWLITGGCGFIGTNLIKNLISQEKENCFISVVDNFYVGTRKDLARVCKFTEKNSVDYKRIPHPGVELIEGNVLDEELMMEVTKGIDIIVHLAADTDVASSVKDPTDIMLANTFGTFVMLKAAKQNKVKKFIFASSNASVGEHKPDKEIIPSPVSLYGASKLSGEAYCSAYRYTYGVKTVVLRFSNVYGPGSDHKNSIVANFIKHAMLKEALTIYDDGRQTRDFIHIDDLVHAIICAAKPKVTIIGETFHIATGVETSVSELTYKLCLIMTDLGLGNIKVQHAAPRVGDIQRSFSDVSKTNQMLEWQAQIELSDGLRKTIEWFIQEQKSRK